MPRASSHSAPATVLILGRGRAGRALARSLTASGLRPAFLPRPLLRGARARPPDMLAIAVPDDAIASCARELAKSGFRCRIAFHLSGALPAENLAPLRRLGANIASFHPLRSFAGNRRDDFFGCPVAIEGDRAAVEELFKVARKMGADPWRIDPKLKPLYHAAATLVAGGTALLIGAAASISVRAGMDPAHSLSGFGALARTAAINIENHGFPDGMTGPVARRDRRTISLHRTSLRRHPELRRLYDSLVELASGLRRVDRGKSRP